MDGLYQPTSDFLLLLMDEAISLEGGVLADANRAQLIALTVDADVSNRDWAVFLLSQSPLDGDDVRVALTQALGDESPAVRDEALLGLAQRDRHAAEPLVHAALAADWFGDLVIEAAAFVASPLLVGALTTIAAHRENGDFATQIAIAAAVDHCRRGVPPIDGLPPIPSPRRPT